MIPNETGAFDAVAGANHPTPEQGGPCATCAFRPGTEAHRTVHTQMLARLCVEAIEPFQCHEKPQACRGWIAAVNLMSQMPDFDSDERKKHREVSAMAAETVGLCISDAKSQHDLADKLQCAEVPK